MGLLQDNSSKSRQASRFLCGSFLEVQYTLNGRTTMETLQLKCVFSSGGGKLMWIENILDHTIFSKKI